MELIDRDGHVISSLPDRVQTSARSTDVVVTPHPITLQGQRIEAAALLHGETLSSFLARVAPEVLDGDWVVSLDGADVPVRLWRLTRPKPGVLVGCRRRPRGDVVKLAAIVAISYFTVGVGGLGAGGLFTAGGAIGGGFLAAAGAFVAGTMLVNSLLGPKQASLDALQSTPTSTTYSLSGGNNQSRPYEPLGLLFGEVRISPDFSSRPFTWYEGQDQYLYEILHGGINCYFVRDVRIGKTPLEGYSDWSTQADGFAGMTQQPLLAWSNVDTTAGAQLPGGPDLGNWYDYTPGPWVTRTTSTGTRVVQVDFEFQLFYVGDKGDYATRHCDIEGQIRLLPDGDWVSLAPHRYTGSKPESARVTTSYEVDEGQYEVRFRKCTADKSDTREVNKFSWSALKSVQADGGYYAGIGRIGLKIKATGQLNGQLDTVNWLGSSSPVNLWNGSAWVVAAGRAQGLSNPGAQMLAYMRGIYGPDGRLQAGMGLSDDMIDIESLQGFMVRCTQMGFTFDWYADQTVSHGDVLNNMAAAGMGSLAWPRGRLGVVWYQEDEPVSGVVNMATIKAGSFRVDYLTLDTADGLEYQFFDRNQDFVWDTIRVTAPNVETPLNPAKVSSVGVTEAAHAAMLARFHVAQSEFQRKSITFETDLEHLTYQRGAVLLLSHDVTQWGYGGRLGGASLVGGTGGTVHLILDDIVPAGSGGYVGLRFLGDRGLTVFPVQPLAEPSRELVLAAPWPVGVPLPGQDGNQVHDTLWMYDIKETPGYRVRVTSVQPDSDLTGATVTCVPEADEFWEYVLTGTYEPPSNQSSLSALPAVVRVEVSEQLVRQGNTFAVLLALVMDYTGSVDHVDIWGTLDENPAQYLGRTATRRFEFSAGLSGVWSFDVRPYDGLGRLGTAFKVNYSVAGLSAPPATVPWFHIDGNRLDWGLVADVDLAGYLIRYHYGDNPSWGDAHPLHDGVVTEMPYVPQSLPQGPLTLMIRALDTSGNQSVASAVIRTQFGDVLVANVVETYDFQALGFPGVITGGAIAGGEIRSDSTSLFYGDDNANFYSHYDSTVFYTSDYAALTYVTTLFGPSLLATGSKLTLELDFNGSQRFIEYRVVGADPMYGGLDTEAFYRADDTQFYSNDGDFVPWPGQIAAQPALYQFRFQAGLGDVQGRIGACRLVIDVPDVVERFNDVAVPVGGMRLPITKDWNQIMNIQLTLQSDGGSAVQAKWIDKDAVLGPLIICTDSAGASVAGNVDAVLQGK